jgi:membrane protease subunit (stomatin/prohibitin family)
MNKRWGTPSPITYNDPKYKFPVGLGAFGNFSFSINKAVDFFRNAVGSLNVYNVRDIQEILLSRITQPMSDYLANAQFSYAEIDKHRNEIAKYCFDATKDIFSNLGFTLDDFRIEGTNFDEATQGRIGKIADMSAEAQAIQELGISYEQYQKLGAMRDLAKNEGGGNMGMQFGMGMEMSKMFTNNQQPTNNQQTNNQQSASSNTPMDEAMQKLEKLKKMFEMGLIDESEYKAKKQEIMSQL